MDTCFLFSKHLNEHGCFCLKISADGAIIAPPAQKNFSDIRTLQQDSRTIIIETTTSASLLTLDLPWLSERKARLAIPYALEDKLAQPVEELHFAFDKLRYQNHQYLVVVIAKQRILEIMHLLKDHQIEFEAITLDWFALGPSELCSSESTLLINNEDFKGALSEELARSYLKNHPLNEPFLFQDSQITPVQESTTSPQKSEEHSITDSRVWIAERILKSKPLNLCQGEMQHGNEADWIKKGYQLVGLLAGVWLLSLLLVNLWSWYSLNKQINKMDERIAVIYREFFPEAKQVISPKFRISQLLSNEGNQNQNQFWLLLNKIAKVMTNKQTTIEQLRYQNKALSVTLLSPDFASLEEIETQLKALNLKVNQIQAATRDQQVIATLELT